jgi:hypothetical protein
MLLVMYVGGILGVPANTDTAVINIANKLIGRDVMGFLATFHVELRVVRPYIYVSAVI